MFPEIFFEIFSHWMNRFSLARSCGGSRTLVCIFSATFPTVGEEESRELLVLSEKFLQNFCG